MRSLYFRAVAFIFILLSVLPASAQRTTVIYQGQQVVDKQVILRLRNNDPQALARVAARISSATVTPVSPSLGVHIVKSGSIGVAALLAAYGPDNDILYAEPDYVIHGTATPSDTQYAQLWGLPKIGAPQAWDVFTGSKNTAVGVIDTGVDYTHPDLVQNMWSAPWQFTVTIGGRTLTCPAGSHGFNAIAFSCDPRDDNSHGTHVSGTIGAVGNNGLGVAGLNWSTQIVGIKFLDSSGSGALSDAIAGIEFAIQINDMFASSSAPVNIRVLSASWGAPGFSQSLLDELNAANAKGFLFVAAAGNSAGNNDGTAFYPAGYNAPNVISVAATDSNDGLAGFSNYGSSTVHLAAPGVGILSTVSGGGYASYSGTSMATPHVSGAALLTLGVCPGLSTAQLKAVLLSSVDSLGSLQGKTITGGRLNVNKALQSCRSAPPPPPPSSSCIASVASDHWKGEYFNNTTISGTPLMVRDDGNGMLNFNSGNEASPSPACNLPGIAYSARWTRAVAFNAGTYRFNTSSDDGMRLYIDGLKVLDRWWDQGASPIATDVPVTAGTHTLLVEFYQNRGDATAAVSWQLVSAAPPVSNCTATVAAGNWKGEYFNNMTLSGSALMVRDDGAAPLNFDWGNEGSPSTACGLPGRQFSVRWTRAVNFSAGSYTFSTTTDDGMRLYVDGQKIVDRWWDQSPSLATTNFTLTAGTHTLVVEYYQNGGGDVAAVNWQSIGGPPPAALLTISSVAPNSVTSGTNPFLTIAGTGLDSTFRAFLVSMGQSTEITSKNFVGATSVQLTPVISSLGDPNAQLQITVGSQSASIGLPILPPAGMSTIALTAPAQNATVSGSVVLSASASAPPGRTITSVQFRVDNGNQGSPVTASPYQTVLDTTWLTPGAHTISALVTDSSGSVAQSAAIAVTVANTIVVPSKVAVTAFNPGGARNGYTGWVGMQFTVGSAPLTVTSLGRIYIAGSSKSHTLKLVRAGDGADVPGASVTVSLAGSPGAFVYGQLSAPVTLTANTSYFLVSQETNGGDPWYDMSAVTSGSVITVNGPVYWTGSTWYRLGIANGTYGPVNLSYQ